MLFNSFIYIGFLVAVFLLYWILPHRFRWPLLLVSSYYFYMSWNAKYVVLILFTTLVSYVAALLLEGEKRDEVKRWIVATAVLLCLAVLFFFKYYNFAILSIVTLASAIAIPLHPVTLNIMLPVGISFYTFQTLGYVIDVYRGDIKAERNFGIYATFVSFFPQLVAGPIERSGNLLCQIREKHQFDDSKALFGIKLMLWGYFKKLVIADRVSVYVDQVYGNLESYMGMDLVLVVFLFAIQIYCDFSGYSEIAIGTANLFGIDLMTNFKSPYYSTSVKEFWGRWHISLSTWFRDYLYIPLGGNRCSKIKQMRNLLVTFLVSGLWHGANWTFVIWGGIHGIAQIIEKLAERSLNGLRATRIGRAVCWLVVFAFCNLAWIFFRAENISDACYIFRHIPSGILGAGYLKTVLMSVEEFIELSIYVAILAVYDFVEYRNNKVGWISDCSKAIQWGWYLLLGIFIIFCTNKGTAAEFVYFQF